MDTIGSSAFKKVAIYCRKSTESEDRQIYSIESQAEELAKVVERQKLNVIYSFKEAKSAKYAEKRLEFKKMIDLIEAGKIDTLLVWSPDRLSRNPTDTGKLLTLMDTNQLKEIITPIQLFENTSYNKFILGMLWSQAKLDNDTRGENVVRGLGDKLKLGWFPFVAPIGYSNTPERLKKEKIILKDKDRFLIVQKLWELMLTGNYTVPEIRNIAVNTYQLRTVARRHSGGGFISRSNMYEMFKNPFYYGWLEVKGKWYQGSHAPMVSKAEFDRVQRILGRTDSRRPVKHVFAYTGMFKCLECGCSITATKKTKIFPQTKRTATYEYYHCTKKRLEANCKQEPVKPQDIDLQIAEMLGSIQIHPDFRDWAINFLKEYKGAESSVSDDAKRNLQRELDRVKERLNNLLNLKLDGLLSDEEFLLKKKEINVQEQDVTSKIAGFDDARDDWYKRAEEAFNLASHAREEFEKSDIFKKREILAKIGSNYYLNDGKLCYDLQKPFFLFKDMNLLKEPKIEWLEPLDYALVTTKVGYYEPENPLWLPRVDSNH